MADQTQSDSEYIVDRDPDKPLPDRYHSPYMRHIIALERERCAKIAEEAVCVFDGPRIRTETWELCRTSIASEIRRGK